MTRTRGQTDLFAVQEAAAPPPSTPDRKLPSYIKGHRQRLGERFSLGGAAAIPDYELLELILFLSMRRGDVKPVAYALLKAFGDFAQVLSASEESLTAIDGVGPGIARNLKVIEAAAHRMARANVLKREIISSWDALLTYCRTVMAHRETEQFRVLFLDTKNALIADEAQAQGTIDHVPVYPREVLKRGLALNAAAIILVHNHPSGDPTPSDADIMMTQKIAQGGELLGLRLHDHLIIGRSREVSFRAEGLL